MRVAGNKSRGLRKKAGSDDQVPALIDSDISPKAFRKNWARLIQKIYNVNPLVCSKIPAPGKLVSYARIYLNAQFHLKKSILTTKPASVIWMIIVGG
jgi:hypothetical protein